MLRPRDQCLYPLHLLRDLLRLYLRDLLLLRPREHRRLYPKQCFPVLAPSLHLLRPL